MTRLALASALLLATFATGCGGRYHRARYVYAVRGLPIAVVAVRAPILAPPAPPMPPEPPMPPPQAAPQTIIVHAPPGSVVIVTPQGGRPQVVRQVPQAAPPPQEAPDAPEQPEAPQVEPQDQGWFQGGR